MDEAETKPEMGNPTDAATKAIGTYCEDKSDTTRLAELLSGSEHPRQTAGHRWLGKKPAALLHLARLEKAGAQAEEPAAIGRRPTPCLCMEQNTERRVVHSAKPDTEYHHHAGTVEETRVCIHVGNV